MKPLELRLTQFGPYRDPAVVRFEALGQLFLICGPTGAGKTTLFDALTYALYERTAGTRGGLTDQLASHHVTEGLVPEVSLRFSLGDQEWRVTRQLRHRVPKKKGEGWTERDPQVALEKKTTEGWEPVVGKRSEINVKLEEMLGLSVEEFGKIVVLPQGDFQRFLEASSSDREKMLQKLFPVEVYDRLVDRLKDRARTVEEERRRWEERWQELTGRLVDLDREALEAAWNQAQEAEARAVAREDLAARKLATLQGLHADWNALTVCRAKQARLDQERPQREADRQALNRARLARPWGADLDRQVSILTEGRRLRSDQDQARDTLGRIEAQLAAREARAADLAAQEARLSKVLKERGLVEHRLATWAKAADLRLEERRWQAEEAAAAEVTRQALEARERARKALTPAPEGPGWDEALATVDQARRAHQAAVATAERRTQLQDLVQRRDLALAQEAGALEAHQAASSEVRLWGEITQALHAADLAHRLVDGQPCPVCGSPHHPNPAGWPEASSQAPERYAEAQNRLAITGPALAVAQERREALDRQIAELSVDETGPSLAEAKASLQAAEARREQLRTWTKAQDIARQVFDEASHQADQAEAHHRQVREAWQEAQRSLAALAPGTEDPAPHLTRLQNEEASLRRSLEEDRSQLDRWTREKEGLTARIFALEEQLEVQREEYKSLQTTLEAAVNALGWTLDDLRQARMPEAEYTRREQDLVRWDAERLKLEGEAATLSARFTEGAPEALEPAVQALEAAKQDRQKAAHEAKEAEFVLRDRDRLEEEIRGLTRQKETLEAEFQRVVPLAKALDGHNPLNLKLTTWVLVQALEEVARSATQRLAAMSGERYALKVQSRGSDARRDWGLDLAVVDGYTGQERAVGTLSGGEKFMTSISLALGLADVIQERSGALRLEAIFIDEGFGTLDDQSLDRAMGILHDLGRHRSVGIISHVAELRQRIQNRVEVVKGKDGSWLRQEP